jgi:hypothetical protein
MNVLRTALTVALFAGAAVSASQASALTVYTVGNNTGLGGDPGYAGQQLAVNFDQTAIGYDGVPRIGETAYSPDVKETDIGAVALYNASISGVAADPYGNTGQFEALGAGGKATFTFGAGVTNVSAYLGSIDTYNYINVLGAGGKVLDHISGQQLLLSNWGDQSLGITNRRVFLTNLPEGFTGLTFGSTGVAFEFDDIAVGSGEMIAPRGAIFAAVPEPETWAMMLVGFGGLGAAMRSRRKGVVATA